MFEDITWIELSEDDRTAFDAKLIAALALCEQPNIGLKVRSAKSAGWFLASIHEAKFKTRLAVLRHLDLHNSNIGESGARIIAEAHHLNQLNTLNLGFAKIGPAGAKFLAAATHFDQLEGLYLAGNQIENSGIKALANAHQFRQLNALDVGFNGVDQTGASTLAKASHLNQLRTLKLDINRICEIGAKALAEASHLSKLCVLDISNNRIGEVGAQALLEATHLNQLMELNIGGNKIGDGGAKALAMAAHLSGLTHLNLHHNQISDEGILALSNASHLSALNILILSKNRIGVAGAQALAANLNFSQLTKLNLHSNHIGDAGLHAISSASHLGNLTSLQLSQNEIGDLGAKYLADATHLNQLSELILNSNKIGSYGASHLVSAVHLGNLIHLNLYGNEISSAGIKAISEAAHLDKLVSLNLGLNKIGDDGIDALARAPHLKTLHHLVLNNNSICDLGAQALADATQLTHLIELDLRYNQIGDTGVRALSQASHLKQLTHLKLYSNRISDQGAQSLAASNALNALFTLDLGANQITDLGAKALALSINLPALKQLVLSENKLTLRRRFHDDLEQLREYLKLDTLEVKRPLLRIRCLLIGAPYAGKTILFDALTGAPYQGLGARARTQGFQRSTAITFKNVERLDGGALNLTLDLWDLGGHTLQHMLHRLFFRTNSLYLFVIDEATLAQPAAIDHWLAPLADLATSEAQSNLIPVLNPHANAPSAVQDLDACVAPFRSSIKIHQAVSVKFTWSHCEIDPLRSSLKALLSQHPVESYWQVHDEIAEVVNAWSDNYLSEEDFERRLHKDPIVQGILGRFKERLAGREQVDWDNFYRNVKDYLDDAGLVNLVPPYVILNPRWVSEGLYVLLPPEAKTDTDDQLAPAAMQQFREKLQSLDLSLGLPGVFSRRDVDAALASKDFIAADRTALLEILSNPKLGLMINLELIGLHQTFLVPHYLDQFGPETRQQPNHMLDAEMAEEIVSAYPQAQACQVFSCPHWPDFTLYQFMVANWPQAENYLCDDRPSFHTARDLTQVHRRRIRMESYDGLLAVDMLMYQNRIWCFGYSQQKNDWLALNDLIRDIKRDVQQMISNHRRERRQRIEVQRSFPCPRCMATIPRLAHHSNTHCLEHLNKLAPGCGMITKQAIEDATNPTALFPCGHPNDKHRLNRSELPGEREVEFTKKSAPNRTTDNLSDVELNHVKGLKALKFIADYKGYALIGAAPATLAKINRGDVAELAIMKRGTIKSITDEWKHLLGNYKDFPKDLLKKTHRESLPSNPYQLNEVLAEYADCLKAETKSPANNI